MKEKRIHIAGAGVPLLVQSLHSGSCSKWYAEGKENLGRTGVSS